MSAAAARSPAVAEGAVVFTDLAGFTEYTALQGDAAALDLLSRYERAVRKQMGRRGRIVKSLGDGLLLWFEDPCDAVTASLALQNDFDDLTAEDGLPLWMRVGIHYGRPARRGRDIIGHDVNVAARIVEIAAPGEVLISEAAAHHVGDTLPDVEFEEIGPVVMKGIPEPVPLYRAARCN